jgi:hypothetical protein
VIDYDNDVRTIPTSDLARTKGFSMEGHINLLRRRWTEMDAVAIQAHIRSLCGSRVKLVTIAQMIGRPLDEVRAAYKVKGGK